MRFIRVSSMKMAWIVFSVVCTLTVSAFGQPWGGNGVEGDPYQIWTPADMQAIGGNSAYWGKHFKLMANINLSAYTGTSFNIIGNELNPFTGVFDGNGHTISNFTYSYAGEIDVLGLFRYIDGPSAHIKDLGLINPNVDAGSGYLVGSLVGRLQNGTITGCYVEGGSVSGDDNVGGLVGNNNGTISNCSSNASVSGTYVYATVGGLAGNNVGTITDCHSEAVSVSGGSRVGGLVGSNDGIISNCYSTGTITITTEYWPVGGLVGTGPLVFFSFWDTETSGQIISAGGIGLPTALMQMESTFTTAGWDFYYTWDIREGTNYPQLAWEAVLSASIDMDEFWMYQSLPAQTNSNLIADVLITYDPMGNSSYIYDWEIILPSDVSIEPVTLSGGGSSDQSWTFAATGCNEPGGISDLGETFQVKVTVTGNDYGNTGSAQMEFGIALLGDVNNDKLVDIADRSITNAIWRGLLGSNSIASPCPLR